MKNVLTLAATVLFFTSCKKNDAPVTGPAVPVAKGVYVLSEGSFGGNNAKLAFWETSSTTLYPDFFLQQNPTQSAGLGDTGNDLLIYGSKLYIVMNNSANVTVLNAATGSFITRISFLNGSVNRNPRYAAAARGKVFVTSYDNSVSIIDTSSLSIVSSIAVGANPEHIIATDSKLYVANSGGLNYPDVDSTISVIDLNSMSEVNKITVGLNPQKLAINEQGNILVSGYGDAFATTIIPAYVRLVDAATEQLISQGGVEHEFDHVSTFRNYAYLYNNYGGSTVKLINSVDLGVIRNNFITDGTVITNVYSVNVDEQNGDVFICDSKNFITGGEVFCFDQEGRKKYSFSVAPGINPNKVAFLR